MARCIRCYSEYSGPPHLMAGRAYCCASCSVGSACEHQGVHRSPMVRRYDTMFDRFRQHAKYSSPYEPRQLTTSEETAIAEGKEVEEWERAEEEDLLHDHQAAEAEPEKAGS